VYVCVCERERVYRERCGWWWAGRQRQWHRCPTVPVPLWVVPQKSHIFNQKSPIFIVSLYGNGALVAVHFLWWPCIASKQPYNLSKEPYSLIKRAPFSVNQALHSIKRPDCLSEEPCNLLKEPHSLSDEPSILSKGPIVYQKSPVI